MSFVRMRLLLILPLVFCLLSSGCAVTGIYPGGPAPGGWLITNVTLPAQELTVATDSSASSSKTGSAAATGVLGMVAFGDASVNAAMMDGGISKVHHVDYKVTSVLFGLVMSTTTIVHGQ